MDSLDLEKKLKALPKARLGRMTGLKIRIRLYLAWLDSNLKQNDYFSPTVARKAVSAAILIIFLFAGASTYAYASDQVTIGHPLYGLKTGLEAAELAIRTDELDKIRISAKLAQRRLSEIESLEKKAEAQSRLIPPIDETLDAFARDALDTGRKLELIEDRHGLDSALPGLIDTNLDHLSRLQKIAASPRLAEAAPVKQKIDRLYAELSAYRQQLKAKTGSAKTAEPAVIDRENKQGKLETGDRPRLRSGRRKKPEYDSTRKDGPRQKKKTPLTAPQQSGSGGQETGKKSSETKMPAIISEPAVGAGESPNSLPAAPQTSATSSPLMEPAVGNAGRTPANGSSKDAPDSSNRKQIEKPK